ncbi:MAG: hypothetical protein HGB22_02685 [Chlorobiaceae bacterium]|nr:hypothetical protein [Chlorobiaceae bacterium]
MKQGFKIVPVNLGVAGSIYTIQLEEESQTEFDKFLMADDVNNQEASLNRIKSKLIEMSTEYGFAAHYFKESEGRKRDYVSALSDGKLRLYCLRIDNTLLVVGNGGVKTTRTYQEAPHLNASVEDLQRVHDLLMKRIYSGRIHVDHNTGVLRGSMNFFKDQK